MRLIAAMVCLACLGGMPDRASAEVASGAQEGVVVDERTGRPLADVYLVGRWAGTYATNIAHSTGESCVRQAIVKSDASGRFHMPAWRQSDTRLDDMYFVVDAYKRGYSQVPVKASYKDSGALKRLFAVGSLEMDAGRFRIVMQPSTEDPGHRAEALVHVMFAAGCSDKLSRLGQLYPLYQAIRDEVSTLPPEAQHRQVGPGELITQVERFTQTAREQYMSEQSDRKEPSK